MTILMEYITTVHGVYQLLDSLKEYTSANPDEPVGLDLETTSLRPEHGLVRTTQISLSDGRVCVIDHFHSVPFKLVADAIAEASPSYYVFNAKFEYRWFDYFCDNARIELRDIDLMRKAVMGGGRWNFKTQVKWDLQVELDKEEQLSDWTKRELSESQIEYAALDAYYTMRDARHWLKVMTEAQWRGFEVMNDAVRGVIEMEDTGMLLDVEHHTKLVKMWERRRKAALRVLRKWVPESALDNLASKQQLSNFFKENFPAEVVEAWPKTGKIKQLKTDRKTLNHFSYRMEYPVSRWLAALMVYNRAEKYLSTYGEKLITTQRLSEDGRIYPQINIAAAVTCRFSSSGEMNEQNYPRNALTRRSFIAGKGKKMVIADYSGIELRTLATLSGDENLMHDLLTGDPHSESAITLFRLDRESFMEAVKRKESKARGFRTRAKSFSFQLTYGAGPPALAVVMRCSDAEAVDYIYKWAEKYPRAYEYRNDMMQYMKDSRGYLPCESGRTIYVPVQDRSLPVASNYPVQGTAADVMYCAIRHLHNNLDAANIDATMMATVHDELLVLAQEHAAKQAEKILVKSMKQGWLSTFPGTPVEHLIESAIGDSWAEKA